MVSLAQLYDAAGDYLSHDPDALASHYFAAASRLLPGFETAQTQTQRLERAAGILTCLLGAADSLGCEADELSALVWVPTSPAQAPSRYIDLMHAKLAEPATPLSVCVAVAAFWFMCARFDLWRAQVKSVAWQRLQAKVLH